MNFKKVMLGLSALVVAAAANAVPVPGVYNSFSLNGNVYIGHATESFVGGGPGQLGNAILAQSWDGAALGSQWEIRGAALTSVALVNSTLVGGNGTQTYHTVYTGGTFYINEVNGVGWGSGNGNLTSYMHDTTFTFVGGNLVGTRTNISATGLFTSNPGYTLDFAIANSVTVGTAAAAPANYPSYIGAPAAGGAYANVTDISIGISAVPEPGSIAAVATGFVGLLGVARRRRA